MDRSSADMPLEFCTEILPPDREETCAAGATKCPRCRKLPRRFFAAAHRELTDGQLWVPDPK